VFSNAADLEATRRRLTTSNGGSKTSGDAPPRE